MVLLALFIFPMHVAEETVGGFIQWFNELVRPPIDLTAFLIVNSVCFLITLLSAIASAKTRSAAILSFALAWLLFLMFANGIFHIVGTIRFDRYSPGTVTAAVLYLPFSVTLALLTARHGQLRPLPFLATLAVIGIPGTIHFYRILFEGSRLL